jgi:hypothetical protein
MRSAMISARWMGAIGALAATAAVDAQAPPGFVMPVYAPPEIDGGPGNDEIHAVARRRTTIRCGPGLDSVQLSRKDKAAKDCEQRVRRR